MQIGCVLGHMNLYKSMLLYSLILAPALERMCIAEGVVPGMQTMRIQSILDEVRMRCGVTGAFRSTWPCNGS